MGLARISHAEVMKGASMLFGEEKQVHAYEFAPGNAEELLRLNVVADEKHALPANGGWSLHFSGVSSGTFKGLNRVFEVRTIFQIPRNDCFADLGIRRVSAVCFCDG